MDTNEGNYDSGYMETKLKTSFYETGSKKFGSVLTYRDSDGRLTDRWGQKSTIREMLPPYGDDPRDQKWIKAGFQHFKNN